jgi:glycerol kinase
VPRAAGPGGAGGAQRVGHEARLPPRHGDPDRSRDLCFGTVDTWIAWTLSAGTAHVTDLGNAAVTGMVHGDGSGWAEHVLEVLRVPTGVLPRIVDSTGVVGEASALPGAPPIAGIAGDQQASLVGQGCVRPGLAKITFGTGGMLDLCVGPERPGFATRGPGGTFPVVAWRDGGVPTWGLEGIMLSAGTAGGVAARRPRDPRDRRAVARRGAVLRRRRRGRVRPRLLGLGTPDWDYGARGALLGLTRGSSRPQVVRAVLEGVAHRGADLVDAAEADGGRPSRASGSTAG